MKIAIIGQTQSKYAVYDLDTHSILAQDLEYSQVVDYILETYREIIEQSIKISNLTWPEAQCYSGQVRCCDCDGKVEKYNSSWPLERQRCNHCLQ